jgi:superfamily II DNA or RNA helicase
MVGQTFDAGAVVVVAATGEHGVVLRTMSAEMVDVALPGGVRLIHADDLRLSEPEPGQLLLDGRFGDPASYGLRLQSLYLQHAYRFDPLTGLSNARIEPQYHQVFVAWRVSQKLQPRMILADEVGLGKTIEAGLVVKELRARGLAGRVLIVCPASLQLQWQQEMKTKFNESFEILDSTAIKYLGRGGANPWARHDSIICSLPFVSHPSRVDAVVETDWDLVIFDEAHRVRRWLVGRKPKSTQAYRLADDLKELVPGLLLLTATPMQLHSYELYSLIELVEPGLFPSFESYERQQGELPRLNELVRELRAWNTLSELDIGCLCLSKGDLLEEAGFPHDADVALSSPGNRERALDALAERHPLANVLVRNRKAEVGGFVKREAHSVLVDLTDEEYELYYEITEYCRSEYDQALAAKNHAVGFLMVTYQKMLASSSHAIRASFERRISKLRRQLRDLALGSTTATKKPVGPDEDQLDAEEISDIVDAYASTTLEGALIEDEISTLTSLVERLGKLHESKAYKLLDALKEVFRAHPEEKVLVFTTFKETLAFLRQVLEGNGYTVSVFHGSLSIDEKEDAVRAFRTKNQVLISTEAGGEGRNFQFCHIVVNYDLPWNPMKVEQRIGRVDRIGQRRTVQIWNLACKGTIEERVLDVLDTRIGLFEESVGSLEPILGTLEDDIVELVMTKLAHLTDEGRRFEIDLEQKVREAKETERQFGDFALDRASFRRDIVNQLLDKKSLANTDDLQRYVVAALSYIGGTVNAHSDGGQVITLSPQAAARLRVRGSTVRGCFDPQEALRFEELQFFAFGNPLIKTLLALPVDEGTTVAARRDPDLCSGIWIETWYEIEASDVRPTGRFLRHLVGPDLEVHSTQVTQLPPLGDRLIQPPAMPDWAEAALGASRVRYHEEYALLRQEARSTLASRQEEERGRAMRIFEYRQQRLRAIIADEQHWVARAELGTNERDKRILPARRGKLDKRRTELDRLQSDFVDQITTIEQQEPRTVARMLAAGLVVGG